MKPEPIWYEPEIQPNNQFRLQFLREEDYRSIVVNAISFTAAIVLSYVVLQAIKRG